jgi:hypothetical protein
MRTVLELFAVGFATVFVGLLLMMGIYLAAIEMHATLSDGRHVTLPIVLETLKFLLLGGVAGGLIAQLYTVYLVIRGRSSESD